MKKSVDPTTVLDRLRKRCALAYLGRVCPGAYRSFVACRLPKLHTFAAVNSNMGYLSTLVPCALVPQASTVIAQLQQAFNETI